MLVLQVLKYKVLDYCLETVFSGIYKNLVKSGKPVTEVDVAGLEVGMRVSRIYSSAWMRTSRDGWWNCKIIEMVPRADHTDDHNSYKMTFSYSSYFDSSDKNRNSLGGTNTIYVPGHWVFVL